jgi:serine/threonine protein phosphatase PrpC
MTTDRKSERRSGGAGSSGRPSASSLTDAVVAALAEVEKSRSEAPIPAEARAPIPEKPAEKKEAAAKPEPASDKIGSAAPSTPASDKIGSAAPSTPASEKIGSAAPSTPVGEKKREDTAPFDTRAPEPVKAAESFAADKTLKDTDRADAIPTDPPPGEKNDAPTVETKAIDPAATEDKTISDGDKITQKHPLTGTTDAPAASTEPKPTPPGITVDYFGRTDVGLVREHNEDNFLVVDLAQQKRGIGATILNTKIEGAGVLFAVCDGMGGAAAGEVASQMAVDTIHEMMQNGGVPRDRDHFARRLVRSIEEAGSRIFAAAKMDRSRRGMGTTSTVAGLVDKTLFVGQVGDSRAYVLRGDQFSLITKDQSLVNQLIEAGQLTEEEAEAFEHSNIILQALGTTEDVTVDLTFLELRRGDRLLMCSDGLSGLVHGDMIKEVVKSSRDLIECANQLIAMANAGGGHDNITVVLAEFDGEQLKVGTPEDKVGYMQYPLPPEDPKDPDPVPRTPTIKSGGPKPGSDVKHDGPRMASSRPNDGGGNRALLIGVLLVVLVLVGVAVLLYSGGEAQGEQPSSRTTTLSHGTTSAAHAASTNLHVLSNLEDATLYVDGVSRGSLSDDMHVTVDPGEHHVEARRGDEVLATSDVDAAPGSGSVVSLLAAELPMQPTDLPPSDLQPISGGAIPTGADLPSTDLPSAGAPHETPPVAAP